MYQFKSRVRFSEVDSHLNMTLPSIINYFQDCSTFHSDSIGQGIEVMMEQGYAWILPGRSSSTVIQDLVKKSRSVPGHTAGKLFSDTVISKWRMQRAIFWLIPTQTGST